VPEAVLVEAQACGLNPQDNWDLMAELVELPERLGGVEVECVAEAEEIMMLVADISKVLVDLGLAPIEGMSQVPNKAREVLKAADSILEHLREVRASSGMARP
jgi:hypothetical protein